MTATPIPMLSEPFAYRDPHRRSVTFFRLLPADIHSVWSEWFRRHGVDPTEVAYPGGVAADDQACFIEFCVAPAGLRAGSLRRVQLEARALPFPVIL